MRHALIDPALFIENRSRLKPLLLANSIAIVNANDVLPTNADGSLVLVPNTDLFYLTGIEQEQSILLLAPQAFSESLREVLFLREPSEESLIWEGHKHSKAEATAISGIKTVKWLSEFPRVLRQLMCEAEHVYLNSNEHTRAACEVQTRDERFVRDMQAQYPLHQYHRLARIMHTLRVVKSDIEIDLLRRAVEITAAGYRRVLSNLRPGLREYEVEADFTYEFVRRGAKFAYPPIVGSGKNACVLHYIENDQVLADGDLLLMDVAAAYANYNADLTRTYPVSGRFSPRQRAVYDAVLRVMRASIAGAVVGKLHRDWQDEAKIMMAAELVQLGLLTADEAAKHTRDEPACRKYFMHGLGHPLGLDVHDVGHMNQPFAPGWVLTVEPGIYLPDEGFAVRLENNIVVTDAGPIDLTASIPVEADEIEQLLSEHAGKRATANIA
jgi:Xaa-Pro aminopeptidase